MSRSRLPLVLGLTAAGGVGYYLYSAGGDPKVAQRQAEGMIYSVTFCFEYTSPKNFKY